MVPLPRALACSWGIGLLFPGEGEVLPAQRGWDSVPSGDKWPLGTVTSGEGPQLCPQVGSRARPSAAMGGWAGAEAKLCHEKPHSGCLPSSSHQPRAALGSLL